MTISHLDSTEKSLKNNKFDHFVGMKIVYEQSFK